MRKDLALLGRAVRIALKSPQILSTVLRMEYRHRLGMPRDRRQGAGFSAPPTNLAICLSLRCNLKCAMCRQIRGGQEVPENRVWYDWHRELPLKAWISLLDQVAAFRPWLYVTGGEPLIYPHFREFVREARSRNLVVHLQTNGTLLADVADFLVQQGVVAVTISLDGPAAIHDEIRGVKGSFRRMQEGVQALLSARRRYGSPSPILSFNCTISKSNLDRLPEIVPLAAELGGDVLQIQHTMFNSPEKVARHNAFFSPERVRDLGLDMAFPSICEGEYYQSEITAADIPKLKESLRQARELARDRIKLVLMPDLPDELLAPYYLDLDHPFVAGCDFFWKTLRVSPDGTYSPCLNFRVGNITEQPMEEIWNGPRMRTLRKLFGQHLYPGCARCCQRHYTEGSRAF